MRKAGNSITLNEDTWEFINNVAERNSMFKSNVIEVFTNVIQDYFSDEQIDLEVGFREIKDGRRKKV